jgi:hypothetical protein
VDEPFRLGASEVPVGRGFAHPVRTLDDLVSIREMAATLRRILDERSILSCPLTLEAGDETHPHRVIVCDAAALREASMPSFVGFFAIKRPRLDHAQLTQVDDQLVTELPKHAGILSYSSIALADGNWGNLIILRSSADGERWREGERHAWAARELAPAHYSSVRLHNGRFAGRLLSDREPVLLRTRYWDYEVSPAWRAERVCALS